MVYTGASMSLNRSALPEVVAVFARLGATAFGGPAAHVALQEQECVERRRWLDHERFLDLLAATNLVPGPNSTEMAMHLGRLRAGLPGLVAGGTAFILPSAVLVTLFAALYVRLGGTPAVENVRLAPAAAGAPAQWIVGASAAVALWGLGASSTLVLLGAVALGVLRAWGP